MAGFLYFIPGEKSPKVTQSVVERAGLREALRGETPACRAGTAGPTGMGMLVSRAVDGARLEYNARLQKWREDPAGGHSVGVWTAAPPGPADLERARTIAGHPVTLAGAEWVVPLARAWPEGSELPYSLAIGPGGMEREILPAYAEISRLAARAWEHFQLLAAQAEGVEAAGEPMTEEELFRMAVGALGVNYCLGLAEAGLLGLLDTTSISAVAGALVDMPTVRELSRRLAAAGANLDGGGPGPDPTVPGPGGGSTAGGAKASPPDTSPPTPTSPG